MVFSYDKYGSFRIFECLWSIMRGEVVINLWCGAVDDSATESEGDGNAREVTVATAAPPATVPKKEARAKGVLKLKSINHEGLVKNEFTPPPEHHPVVEVQQPKGEVS